VDIQQNTLYLLTPGSYVNRDHLTLQVEVPVYPDGLPPEQRDRKSAIDVRKLSIPIHHLESICVFGASTLSPPALDLMEEFRPWLADRLAITLINRQQVGPEHFNQREGGAVEFTDAGRKLVIKAYQERKQESLTHPLLDQNLRVAQLPFVQARILARHLRGDIADYLPFVPK